MKGSISERKEQERISEELKKKGLTSIQIGKSIEGIQYLRKAAYSFLYLYNASSSPSEMTNYLSMAEKAFEILNNNQMEEEQESIKLMNMCKIIPRKDLTNYMNISEEAANYYRNLGMHFQDKSKNDPSHKINLVNSALACYYYVRVILSQVN